MTQVTEPRLTDMTATRTPGLPFVEDGVLVSTNPATGAEAGRLPVADAAAVTATVQRARVASLWWAGLGFDERKTRLLRWRSLIAERIEELAALTSLETGKPTADALVEAVAAIEHLDWSARNAKRVLGPRRTRTRLLVAEHVGHIEYLPYGVVGVIGPWNYPILTPLGPTAGALAAGNAVVLKPSEDACLSLIRVAQLAAEVGFPAGAINIVTGYGHEVGDALARHPGIDHISFTGSPTVGTLIQQVAAERHCPVTLELGGKSPQIIFEDADLDQALPMVINAIVQNAGQTCSAGSRLLVQQSIYEPLLERLGQAFEGLRVGPAAMDLDVGPLIRASQQQRVWDFLSDAQVAGIPMVAQGQVVDEAPETGYYQAPTLLRDVPVTHRLAQEEVFGPVLCAMSFKDENHAAELANATQFGLVAGIWTRDGARQFRMARRVKSGQVFINNYGAGGGVELPFGGVKSSGYGREKGFEALYGFTTLKTVAVRHG